MMSLMFWSIFQVAVMVSFSIWSMQQAPETHWFFHWLVGFCLAYWVTAILVEWPWKIRLLFQAAMRRLFSRH